MNTSIMLVPAAKEDLGEHEGFRVLFTKHRGFVPEAMAAVAIVFEEGEARLVCAPDLEARKAEKARVIELAKEHPEWTQAQIAAEVFGDRKQQSKVSRILGKNKLRPKDMQTKKAA